MLLSQQLGEKSPEVCPCSEPQFPHQCDGTQHSGSVMGLRGRPESLTVEDLTKGAHRGALKAWPSSGSVLSTGVLGAPSLSL